MTFFFPSAGDCSAGRRAGTGMRLGEFCKLERREWLVGRDGIGLVGVPGVGSQSSGRFSSQGWWLIADVLRGHGAAAPARGTIAEECHTKQSKQK